MSDRDTGQEAKSALSGTSVRVQVRSETHEFPHMRMRHEDVDALKQQRSICKPIIALFSTDNARTPVSLRSDERLYVRLGDDCAIEEDTEADSTETEDGSSGNRQTQATHSSITSHRNTRSSAYRATAEDSRQHHKARKRANPVWTPLRVLTHHSCVVGMRVSGIVHRAIVRLQPERA